MKKKWMVMFLAVCLVFTLSACGNNSDKKVVYDYDYDLDAYIELGQYKGIEYTPTAEFTRTTVEEGDKINLDYVGKIDGEEFAGGSTQGNGTEIVVGQANYIAGFEEGLVGMSIGSTADLNLAFPADYHEETLAGKPVIFTVTINEIIVEDPLKADKAALWDTFTASCKVKKYPKKELNALKKQYKEYHQSYAEAYGMQLSDFLESSGLTEKEFEANADEYAKNMVSQDMALFKLARDEKIEVTDEEYDAAKAEMIESYGFEDQAAFEEAYNMSMDDEAVETSIRTTALLQKVLDFIYTNAKAV